MLQINNSFETSKKESWSVQDFFIEEHNYCLDIGTLEIYNGAFSGCNSLDKVFVLNGDIAEITWTKGFVDAPFNNPFYYSENEPTDEGNYWHYVDDVPTVWDID